MGRVGRERGHTAAENRHLLDRRAVPEEVQVHKVHVVFAGVGHHGLHLGVVDLAQLDAERGRGSCGIAHGHRGSGGSEGSEGSRDGRETHVGCGRGTWTGTVLRD